MTDRYSVDALASQYDEIAGICMMGKPVILTRDKEELVLMNPAEFRKMMQLVSRIQETNKEKDMAVDHAGKLEKELARVQEDLARRKRELEKAQEDLATARKDLDEARAEAAQAQAAIAPAAAAAEMKAGQIPTPEQPAQEAPEIQNTPELQHVQTIQAVPDLTAETAAAETDSEIIEETGAEPVDPAVVPVDPAVVPVEPIPAMPDLPAGDDRKARFLKAVASSLERRSSMVMEAVPEGLAIDVEALTKKYSGVEANSKLSLHVPYGAVYALLGLNGSGRSTLVKNLLGLTFPNSGRIGLCNASGKELNDIRELTGSVMDVPVLYEHMSINQNMIYRAKLLRLKTPKPAIKEALKRFGLFDKKRKKVRTLSSGAKQKLALALAILGNPELLILDEPLKGLDAADIAVFCDVMMEMNAKGSTILITDCRTDGIAGIATHYGILQDGQLIREVSARQLLQDPVDLDVDYLAAGEV